MRPQYSVVIVFVAIIAAASGNDQTRPARKRPSDLERYAEIPSDAIKIPLPSIRQPDEFSCGAAALMSICKYYGVGPGKLADLGDALGTNKDIGTYFKNIVAYARQLGLKAGGQDEMTRNELKKLVHDGIPVVCSIQAYADDKERYGNPQWNQDGHYVVAIGFDDCNVYFMDPSIDGRRGFLPWREFEDRWHENEGTESTPEVHERLGIWVTPPKKGTPFLRFAARID